MRFTECIVTWLMFFWLNQTLHSEYLGIFPKHDGKDRAKLPSRTLNVLFIFLSLSSNSLSKIRTWHASTYSKASKVKVRYNYWSTTLCSVGVRVMVKAHTGDITSVYRQLSLGEKERLCHKLTLVSVIWQVPRLVTAMCIHKIKSTSELTNTWFSS